MLHLSPQGGAKLLGIVQWEAQESDTGREAKRDTGGRSEVLLDTEGQDSRSDLLRILLFTKLWTSSARLHFNEVLWRSMLDGSGAGVPHLAGMLPSNNDFFLCGSQTHSPVWLL